MTQGQVYSHWGKVDDEVHLDRSQVEGMLALRTVYHADMSRSTQQRGAGTARAAAHPSSNDDKAAATRCASASGSAAVQADAASCAQTSRQPEGRARVEAVDGVDAGAEAQVKCMHTSGVQLQAAGMSQQEQAAAAKEHNKRVLATAGLEAVGRQDAVDGGGGAHKRQRAGGTVKKLEKMMRKKFARS